MHTWGKVEAGDRIEAGTGGGSVCPRTMLYFSRAPLAALASGKGGRLGLCRLLLTADSNPHMLE